MEVFIDGTLEDVLAHICRALIDIWAEAFVVGSTSPGTAESLLIKWRGGIAHTTEMVDWNVWSGC